MKKIVKVQKEKAQSLEAYVNKCGCWICSDCFSTSTQALDFAYNTATYTKSGMAKTLMD